MPTKAPPDLTSAQIMERERFLEQSAPMQAYAPRFAQYHRTLLGTQDSDLPAHMLEGDMMELHSTRAVRVMGSMLAEFAAYPVYVTVTPSNPEGSGAITQPLKKKADNVERWDTLAWHRLDDGSRASNTGRAHQLSSPYFVWVLHCDDPDPEDGWCWRLETCAEDCYFPEETGGPFRPKIMARRFKLTVKEVVEKYSNRSRGKSRGKNLMQNRDGTWKYEPIGEARPGNGNGGDTNQQEFTTGYVPGFAETCEMVILYTEDATYHYVLNRNGKDAKGSEGELVWSGPNVTGGVPAVVVPGQINPVGGDGEKMLPRMYEILSILRGRNTINDIRMTLATRERPEMVVNMEPEALAEARKRGWAVPANEQERGWGTNAPGMILVSGEVTNWVVAPNLDLDKIDQQLIVELDAACNAMVPSTDTQLAAAATAEAWTSVTGTQNRQQTPMLQHKDWATSQILDMVHCSIRAMGEGGQEIKIGLAATKDYGRKSGGAIKGGEYVVLSPADLEFKFTVTVATTQETEEQRSRRVDRALFEVQNGLTTLEQAIAVLYPDTDTQLEELVKDLAIRILQPASLQFLATAYQGALLTRAGILVPMSAQDLMPPPPPGAAPQQAGGGGQRGGGVMAAAGSGGATAYS